MMYPLIKGKSVAAIRFAIVRRCYCKMTLHNNRTCVQAALICRHSNEYKPHSKFKEPLTNNILLSQHVAYVHTSPLYSFYTRSSLRSQEPSSKVEETINSLRQDEKDKEDKQKAELKSKTEKSITQTPEKAVVEKKTLWQRVKAELIHYYHGFRLLGLDMKVSAKLIWRILQGHELNRREHRLLVKTVGDMFRLIPFSVFIIVPFMEFLLPFFIKFFPGMLPSTFQTSREKEDKLKQALKVKMEVAKFLQKTLDEMAVQSSEHRSQKAKEFAEFFEKLRTTGKTATNEDIMRFSQVFEDEITLDSLSRPQLIALCRVLDVQTLGTTNFLRFLLRMKLRSLAADDRLIEKEGVDALNRTELQQACRARGMRAYGMSEQRLREQLSQWLDLSLAKKVPPSLLLLSRALMVPENAPTHDKLKATISALPESVVARTKGAIGEKEGKLDHRTNIEIIKLEEQKIKEEREEEEKATKEQKVIPQPVVVKSKTEEDEITTTDVKVLEQALDTIGKDTKKMTVEKEELKELKEEMAEYQEDIQELYKMKQDAQGVGDIENLKVSKGAQRLFTKVNKMIGKMDAVLQELEESEKKIKKKISDLPEEKRPESDIAAELVRIDELMAAIKQIQNVPDDHRLLRISEILGKMDIDKDGSIKVEDVLRVVELIGKEDIHLSKKQVNEVVELMKKEEVLELEEQIQKKLQKESQNIKKVEDEKEEIVEKSTSEPPVLSASNTEGKKLDKEELKDADNITITSDTGIKNIYSVKEKKVKETRTTPKLPPTPKKAEGSKHL